MRTNKISGVLRTLTAMVLSIGLIAGPCYEFSSGGLVSLAASNGKIKTPTELEYEQESDTEALNEDVNNDMKSAATPTELENNQANSDDTLLNAVAINVMADSKAELKKNRALIIVSESENIVNGTKADAEALAATLRQTNEFRDCADDDITIMYFADGDQDDANKEKVWTWINKTAKNQSDDSLTVIAYAGHGGYNNDGTSLLGIGGESDISAAELKSHTGVLHGKVMVTLLCCYSGAMIMPIAGDSDEFAEPSALMEQAQLQSDKFASDFVSDFKSAKAATSTVDDEPDKDIEANTDSGNDLNEDINVNAAPAAVVNEVVTTASEATGNAPRYFIFAEASPYEMAYSGLRFAIESGLGHDSNNPAYNIYNADTDGNHEVTMAELAAYVKSAGYASEPTVTPAGSKAVLFTYDKDKYKSPIFSMKVTGNKNVKVVDDKVTIDLNVSNYYDADIKLEFIAYKQSSSTPDPDSRSKDDIINDCGKNYVMTAGKYRTIGAKSNVKVTLKFDGSKLDDKLKLTNGGKYIIKAFGRGDCSEYFAFETFTTSNDGSSTASAPDTDAFAVKSPAVVRNVLDAVKASQIVPIRVAFDTEPTDKTGSAACVLSAVACRLGDEAEVTKAGYYVGTDGLPFNKSGVKVEFTKKNSVNVFNNVRPVYGEYARDTFAENNSVKGSTYTDSWDVSELDEGYYALKVSCRYDDGATKYKTTFVKVTDRAEADADDYKIGEFLVEMTNFASSQDGEGYIVNADKQYKTVKDYSRRLEKYLNMYAFSKYGGKEKENASYTVGDWERYDDAKGKWVKLKKTDELKPEVYYSSEITIKLADDYKARFTDGTVFTFSHHTVYDGLNDISADGKQAKVTVLHFFMDISSDEIKVTFDHNNAEIEKWGTLPIGHLINVAYDKSHYSIEASDALKLKDETPEYTQYEVVKPKSNDQRATIFVYDINKDTEITSGCGCAVLELYYKVDTSPQGDGDSDHESDGAESGAEEDKDDAGDKSDNDDAGDKGDNADKNDSNSGNNGASDTAYNKRAARNSSGRVVSTAVSKADGTVTGSWQRENDGTWHYALSGGGYAKGWNRINYDNAVRWFYFDDDRDMHTGWLLDNNRWYYLGGDGAMLIGWVKDKNTWYFLDADGSMHTGWLKDNDKWYYLGRDGAMLTGWIEDSGKHYYIGSEGILQTE